MSLIEYQKLVGKEILDKLKEKDPAVFIGGGAPRDWYNNNPASDLDVYFNSSKILKEYEKLQWDMTSYWSLETFKNPLIMASFNYLSELFPDVSDMHVLEGEISYNFNEKSIIVIQFEYKEVTVQFITNIIGEQCIEEFALNVSQILTRDCVEYFATEDFELGFKHKALYRTSMYTHNRNNYLQKITSRFPDFTYINQIPLKFKKDTYIG